MSRSMAPPVLRACRSGATRLHDAAGACERGWLATPAAVAPMAAGRSRRAPSRLSQLPVHILHYLVRRPDLGRNPVRSFGTTEQLHLGGRLPQLDQRRRTRGRQNLAAATVAQPILEQYL